MCPYAHTSTSTPIPTPTSTPVPYDLIIQVTDADGNPIANVTLNLAEFNNNASQITGANGKIVWQNLSGDTVTLNAMAQGYFPVHETKQIERGENLVSLVLKPAFRTKRCFISKIFGIKRLTCWQDSKLAYLDFRLVQTIPEIQYWS
jgi:hypothetical protein